MSKEHVCGLNGFDPMKGDICEACNNERRTRMTDRHDEALERLSDPENYNFDGNGTPLTFDIDSYHADLNAYIEQNRRIEAERDALRAVAEAADSLLVDAEYDDDHDAMRVNADKFAVVDTAIDHAREVGVDL